MNAGATSRRVGNPETVSASPLLLAAPWDQCRFEARRASCLHQAIPSRRFDSSNPFPISHKFRYFQGGALVIPGRREARLRHEARLGNSRSRRGRVILVFSELFSAAALCILLLHECGPCRNGFGCPARNSANGSMPQKSPPPLHPRRRLRPKGASVPRGKFCFLDLNPQTRCRGRRIRVRRLAKGVRMAPNVKCRDLTPDALQSSFECQMLRLDPRTPPCFPFSKIDQLPSARSILATGVRDGNALRRLATDGHGQPRQRDRNRKKRKRERTHRFHGEYFPDKRPAEKSKVCQLANARVEAAP
jgi:hypothetical protein